MSNSEKAQNAAPQSALNDTRETLKRLYVSLKNEQRLRSDLEKKQNEPIAIIGMGCRFPAGANTPEAFWNLLQTGKDGISQVPPDRWDAKSLLGKESDAARDGRMITADGGFLDVPLTRFDHPFFRLSPKEARALDPQHRLLLEVTWEALENAGIVPETLIGGRTGVFVGLSGDDYSLAHRHSGDLTAIDAYSLTGSTASTAAGRIAYFLGTEGPAFPVDTACSSALVAIHLACQSLRNAETDLNIVGGVNLILAPGIHVCFSRLQAISPDGRCKTFDAGANGYSRAEGCGMVILKRLSDAQRDGDRILATIRSSAVNQDGASNGFTAPNGAAQKRLINQALEKAGLQPTDIQYVETHGTGTPLGDPIEVSAIADTLGKGRHMSHPLVLGAVKSNIGHLEAAAGMAGLIKVIMALRHNKIPGNLHFKTPNPHIPWDEAPIAALATAQDWPEPSGPAATRHAGLSAFGFSGTNAHLIIGEAPESETQTSTARQSQAPLFLPLSAKSDAALIRLAERVENFLNNAGENEDLYDICATALRHRTAFPKRLAVQGNSPKAIAEALKEWRSSAAPTSGLVVGRQQVSTPETHKIANDWVTGKTIASAELYPNGSYTLADLPTYAFDPLPCYLGETENPIIPQRSLIDIASTPNTKADQNHPFLMRRFYSPLLDQAAWDGELSLQTHPLLGDHRVLGHPVMPAAGYLSMVVAAAPDLVGANDFVLEDIRFIAPLVIPESGTVTVQLVIGKADDSGKRQVEIASVTDTQATRHFSAILTREAAENPGSIANTLSADLPPISSENIYTQQGSNLELGSAFRRATGFAGTDQFARAEFEKDLPRDWEHALHPGIMDAGLQLLPTLLGVSEDAALVPVAIRQMLVRAPRPSIRQSVAKLDQDGNGQIEYLDATGNTILHLSGIEGRKIKHDALAAALGEASASSLTAYVLNWRPITDSATEFAKVTSNWSVLHTGEQQPEDDTPNIIWLSGSAPDETCIPALVSVIQTLVAKQATSRLWIATCGAQKVLKNDPVDPVASALWGIGRTFAKEHPNRFGGLIDLEPRFDAAKLPGLLESIGSNSPYRELALRDDRLHHPQLEAVTEEHHHAAIRDDRTYLVSGGNGALGKQVVGWLITAGARHIDVVSRRTASTELRAQLDDLGADIAYHEADISDLVAIQGLFGQFGKSRPPLAGIFHLAGAAGAAMLSDIKPADIPPQTAAKIRGAKVLDQLSRDLELDHFVLFSSAAGTLGAEGQALYAASNAYLDGLAAKRVYDGLPALSLAWGPWDGDGMASSPSARMQIAKAGLGIIAPEAALAFLEQALGARQSRLLVPGNDFKPSAASLNQTDEDAASLAALPANQRRTALMDLLLSEAASALGFASKQEVPRDLDLFELGLDSLMALRIRNAAEAALQTTLPTTLVFEHPTIAKLHETLMDAEPDTQFTYDEGSAAKPEQLSAGQKGLWLLHKVAPESAAFHTCFTARSNSPLDVTALGEAFKNAIRRHALLGNVLNFDGNEPVNQYKGPDAFDIKVIDASGLDQNSLMAAVKAAYRVPFRLEHELPLRVTVWQQGPSDWTLLIVAHHISMDVWSFELLLREIGEDYETLTAGHSPQTLPPEVTFADHVARTENRLMGGEGDRLRAFWRQRLIDAPAAEPPLFADNTTQNTRFEGQTYHFTLKGDLARKIEEFGKSKGATLFATLMSSWVALEHRLTGRRDIMIGAPALGRNDGGLENTLGFFVNVLPIRTILRKDVTWEGLLDETRKNLVAGMEHQGLPFRDITALLPDMAARNDFSPLFQTLFHLRTIEDPDLAGFFAPDRQGHMKLGPIDLEPFYIDQQDGQYPLVVEWFKLGNELHCALKYNTACLDEERVSLLAECYQTFLAQLVDHSDKLIADLNPVTKIKSETGGENRSVQITETIHQRILQNMMDGPDETAITAKDVALSRAQLDMRANALANALLDSGVAHGDNIGVFIDRSAEMIMAMLAALKTGAVFVPLPTDLPDGRLQFILKDANIGHTITTPDHRKVIEGHGCNAVCLDPENLQEIEHGPSANCSPDDPAYILYTSGTTGRPKGVILPHRAMVSYVDAMQRIAPLDQKQDAVLLQTPVSFDPAMAQIFLPLISGTRVVIAEPDAHHDPAAIIRSVIEQDVTVMYSVPSQLEAWLDHPDFARCKSLKHVFSGGEILRTGLIERMSALVPNARLFNVYGPTEATVNVTCWPTSDVINKHEDIAIGYPLANADITVRDDFGRILPAGMAGEITIGGNCLALGYLNQPEEDASAFVDHPDRPGAKLYRTGDVGRFTRDHSGKLALHFLGRKDRQVKVRGNRIELGEVEAVLGSYPDIREAYAAVQTAPSGEKLIVAAITAIDPAKSIDTDKLRDHAASQLASAAIPRRFLCLPSLPLNRHGKIDTIALLAQLATLVSEPGRSNASSKSDIKTGETTEEALRDIWRHLLGIDTVQSDQHFFDLGGSSLMLMRLQRAINERGLGTVEIVDLFRNPTIKSQADLLRKSARTPSAAISTGVPSLMATNKRLTKPDQQAHAIIGMSLRAPGAKDLAQFWEMVLSGQTGITHFDKDALRNAGVAGSLIEDANYVPANGVLDGIELFDARFFGYGPREAELLDPQHRLFLETAWHTLEHAGYGQRGPKDRVGVFAGSEISNYLLFNLAGQLDPSQMNGGYELALANDKDFLATRVSYALDLRGPAMTVQTACSTSLTAVVQACESLRSGQCEMALAGGVSIQLPQAQGYLYQEGMVASKDGTCRPFDANASGTINGNGVAAVLLKPLDRAIADGDTIHGVLRGWGINNDGHHKLGYTAPGEIAQAAAISEAWLHAGLAPEDIGYIETHGTGTPLGDPIEIAALARAWRDTGGASSTAQDVKCALGAVKANIGHLGAAAGVAGLIKATLSVREGQIPPLAGFTSANPKIPFGDLPFAVPEAMMPWPDKSGPRIAAVSSFGIGGTNVHVVVGEAPAVKPTAAPDKASLPLQTIFPISAGSREGLEKHLAEIGKWVGTHDDASLSDLAYTLQCGRDGHGWRSVIKATNRTELINGLSEALAKASINHCHDAPDTVALFPGQGAQYPDMMLDLYQTVESFRADVDHGLSSLSHHCASTLDHWKSMLFPSLYGVADAETLEAAAAFLARTENTQPALFIIEYALARLYERIGVTPVAMLGHSVGEYVAATLSGVLSFEDGVKLVAARGRLMQGLPAGDMLAVATSIDDIKADLPPDVDIAGDNGPRQCVLSGTSAAIAALQKTLQANGLSCQVLPTSHAFHSSMMDPILDSYREILATVALNAPQRPVISCLTGDWLSTDQAIDPNYWVAQLRGAVMFGKGLATMMEKSPTLVLEMGPGRALSSRARQIPASANAKIIATDPVPRRAQDRAIAEKSSFPGVIAELWQCGVSVHWDQITSAPGRRRLEIPLYPFDRQRYWIDATTAPQKSLGTKPKHAASPPEFFAPNWQSVPLGTAQNTSSSKDALFVIAKGKLADSLGDRGLTVNAVDDDLNAEELLSALGSSDAKRKTVIVRTPAFFDIVHLAKRLAEHAEEISLILLSEQHDATNDGELEPDTAMLVPLALGLTREMPNMHCRLVVCDNGERLPLHRELDQNDPVVLWFKGRRRLQKFEPVSLDANAPSTLRTNGIVLITGGLGGIGLKLAKQVITRHDSSVFLIGRTAAADLSPAQKTALADLGPRAKYCAADVTDLDAMRAAIECCERAFGAPTAVIHAAGTVKQGPILAKSDEDINSFIAPKRDGGRVLDQLFEGQELDGMFFFSSSSAVLGNSGMLDYAAANAFLDGLAHKRTREGYPTISVGWDGWKDIGMSAASQHGRDQRLLDIALDPDEAISAFSQITGCIGLAHILVAGGDLAGMRDRIEKTLGADLFDTAETSISGQSTTIHKRPDLAVDYIAPSTMQEIATLKIWEDILGVSGIGVADNFFDLGGDSLIGSRLIARMKSELKADLTPVQLYEASTIQAMAATLPKPATPGTPGAPAPGNGKQPSRQDDDLDIEVRSSRRRRRTRRSETPQP